MTTKLKDMLTVEPGALVDAVAASAQQIWQAGLGAFGAAHQDGGALFDKLVREGAQLHKLTQELGGDRPPGVTDKVGRLAESMGRQASGSWDKIEKIFEDRVAAALRSLGVPSRDDVEALRREIEALKAAMPRGGQKRGARAPESAVKPAKAAVKRAPAKAAAIAPSKKPSGARGARA